MRTTLVAILAAIALAPGCGDDSSTADVADEGAAPDADADADAVPDVLVEADAEPDAEADVDIEADGSDDTNEADADADGDGDADVVGPDPTTLRIHYDTGLGNRITVRGDGPGLSWTAGVDATWTAGNVWVYETDAWDASVEFKPVFVDASDAITWAPGSNWRVEPRTTLDIYPFFFREHGRVESVAIDSAVYGATRDAEVYLPPSYDESGAAEKRYPILFMQDGQNLFDPGAFSGGWALDASLDLLLVGGGIDGADGWVDVGSPRELIVVTPHHGGAQRLYEYTPTDGNYTGCDPSADVCSGGGGTDQYLEFLLGDVEPWVDARYRTLDEPPGIAGSSLGGLVSLYACWSAPTDFHRCGVFSPSLWWQDSWIIDQVAAYSGPKKDLLVYLDAGTASDGLSNLLELYGILAADTDGHRYVPGDDLWCLEGIGHEHNELAWRIRAPWAVADLYADPDRVRPDSIPLPSDLAACSPP